MVGFKAVTFQGKRTATKAFHTLEEYSPEYYWIDDVAVVSRSKHGHVRIHSTWAQDESGKSGLAWGAVTGGVIGMIFGPGGAAAGAAVGALVSDDKGKGALIGAAVGAAAGYAAGSYVADQKEKYATDEEYLNAAIEEATRFNLEARQRNDTLEKVIATTEQEIKVLKYKINDMSLKQHRAQVNVRALTRISQETEQRIAELQGLINSQEKAIGDISADKPQLKELQREMQITRDQIQDLKEKRNQLETLMGEMAEQTV